MLRIRLRPYKKQQDFIPYFQCLYSNKSFSLGNQKKIKFLNHTLLETVVPLELAVCYQSIYYGHIQPPPHLLN